MENQGIAGFRWRTAGRRCGAAAALWATALAAFALLSAARGEPYTLGPEDVIEVKVWGYENLNVTTTIGEDGTIAYPMVGRVQAGGLTAAQLEMELRKRLSDGIVLKPEVNVSIKQYASKKVIVLGEAERTGLIPIRRSINLIELVAQVGVKPDAGNEIVVIKKVGTPEQKRLRVLRSEILEGNVEKMIDLVDGDVVIFPKGVGSTTGRVFIFGQVSRPGMVDVGSGKLLREVIMACGGMTREASGEIVVVRGAGEEGATEKPASANPGDAPPTGAEASRKTGEEGGLRVTMSESYDLKEIMLGRQRAMVYSGDTVYLASQEEGSYYLMGQVRKTGRYPLRKGMTMLEAIAEAGGFTDIANPNRVTIIRRVGGKLTEIKAKDDAEVQPGDIIKVPESWI